MWVRNTTCQIRLQTSNFIPVAGETKLKLRLKDLARLPPVGIIKGLLLWPDNCMLLHVHLHVCRFCTVPGTNFFLLLLQWAVSGSLVVSMWSVRQGD